MFSAPHRTPSRRVNGPNLVAALATAGAALLLLVGAIAPYPDPDAALARAALDDQSVDIAQSIEPVIAERDVYAAEISPQRQKAALVAEHTNYSWAKLVLWYGGWPITDESVTTIVRWMRQENYVDNWWNRNNPLNNGWGVGNYMNPAESLDASAAYAADAIHSLGGYAGIKAAFESAVPSDQSAYAIWYSSWATGHYDYGGHWSTAPVPVVEAPAEAWGI
ncbi:MAG TPA: hypothetical protein VNQ52_12010 [Microbacteriaceae bacterium]|nr:hypothetical protein [Microbacteriaceae bacterium]